MFQIVYEQSDSWSEDGARTVRLPAVEIEVTISPEKARRRANGYLISEVSMSLHATNPALVIEAAPLWRFDLTLRLREHGTIATLGALYVDARSGAVLPLHPDVIRKVQDQANDITGSFTRKAA